MITPLAKKAPSILLIIPIVFSITGNSSNNKIYFSTSWPWNAANASNPLRDSTGIPEWKYWGSSDVKGLDSWGEPGSQGMDIVALYEKEETDFLAFRLDFMDLQSDAITPTFFAIDFTDGGSTQVEPENSTKVFNIAWDLMVMVSGTQFTLYDSSFSEHSDWLAAPMLDRQLDYLMFKISRTAFSEWDGTPFQMQAATQSANGTVLDGTSPFHTDDATGRAKLVLPEGNSMYLGGPYAVSWYDGYDVVPDYRPGERRGLRYLLDAVEKYEIPIVLPDLRTEILPTNEYLRINDRIRGMAGIGLLEPLTTLEYGHFMAWQPNDADAKAIDLAKKIRTNFEIPVPGVFYPYEAMLTPGDIQVIKNAGFEAIYGMDQYRYWFGWDYSEESIKAPRKIHIINGEKFVFDPRIGNYQGFAPDERWEKIDWSSHDESNQFLGTDGGLDIWWRRILQDMALDPDQEQFFSIGTDIQISKWMFADVAESNLHWLASHPWIEVTSFSDILNRNWTPIDHGTLDLAADELLARYPYQGDGHYNAYFPQHYYGGISDGHSPIIPKGAKIESYYDYVPYLRGGELIPSERIMGDDKTPGSIIYETLRNLRAAPDNNLTELAWLSYLMNTGEQTFHQGADLDPAVKVIANFVSQSNKLVYAAHWAEQAAQGTLTPETMVIEQDLDLDGEMEYVLQNNQTLGIFENDGGRLEYAFAYDAQYGPIQLVSPASQYTFGPGGDYTEGEAALLVARPWSVDGAFVEDYGEDGKMEYGIYTSSHDNTSLTFFSNNGMITKTFTLEGDTIQARYKIEAPNVVDHLFQLSVNPLGIFQKDWVDNYSSVDQPFSTGWKMSSGGFAMVNYEDASLIKKYSFLESPARDEMQARDNPDTYPSGHGLCFPCGIVKLYEVGAKGNGNIGLTLRANPAIAPLSTPTAVPTASTPPVKETPTHAPVVPGMNISTMGLVGIGLLLVLLLIGLPIFIMKKKGGRT